MYIGTLSNLTTNEHKNKRFSDYFFFVWNMKLFVLAPKERFFIFLIKFSGYKLKSLVFFNKYLFFINMFVFLLSFSFFYSKCFFFHSKGSFFIQRVRFLSKCSHFYQYIRIFFYQNANFHAKFHIFMQVSQFSCQNWNSLDAKTAEISKSNLKSFLIS